MKAFFALGLFFAVTTPAALCSDSGVERPTPAPAALCGDSGVEGHSNSNQLQFQLLEDFFDSPELDEFHKNMELQLNKLQLNHENENVGNENVGNENVGSAELRAELREELQEKLNALEKYFGSVGQMDYKRLLTLQAYLEKRNKDGKHSGKLVLLRKNRSDQNYEKLGFKDQTYLKLASSKLASSKLASSGNYGQWNCALRVASENSRWNIFVSLEQRYMVSLVDSGEFGWMVPKEEPSEEEPSEEEPSEEEPSEEEPSELQLQSSKLQSSGLSGGSRYFAGMTGVIVMSVILLIIAIAGLDWRSRPWKSGYVADAGSLQK